MSTTISGHLEVGYGGEIMKFCGRSNELHALAERWNLARDIENPQPQVVVICGEAGIGKTRLAMEFFEWIRCQEDAPDGGFWPASPVTDRGNIPVNPDGSRCNYREHEIPFLWWGVRASDILKENAVHGDAIGNNMMILASQLVALTLRSRYLGRGLGEVAASWTDFIARELVGNLSGVGPLLAFGENVVKTVRVASETYHQATGRDAQDEGVKRQKLRDEILLDDLSEVLSPASKGFARKPGVILFDDAQFFLHDGGLSGFAAQLMHRAISERWPVMIISSHWLREFKQGIGPFVVSLKHARDGQGSIDQYGIVGGYLREENYKLIELNAIIDMRETLSNALPGLKGDQVADLNAHAGGNPRHLEQIVSYLNENEGLFEDFDVGGPLTQGGLREAKAETQDITKTINSRLRSAPKEVQEAVCIASVIGMRFVDKIVEAIAVRHIDWRNPDALEQAVNPYSIIRDVSDGSALEFADRLFYSAAVHRRRSLKQLADTAALTKTVKGVVKEQYLIVTTHSDYKPVTRSKSKFLEERGLGPSCENRLEGQKYKSLVIDIAADVFAEDEAEPHIEFECLRAKLDLRVVEQDVEQWRWLSRRFLRIFEKNPGIRTSLENYSVVKFAKLFRLTGFFEEALSFLNSRLVNKCWFNETWGYDDEEAREVTDLLMEAHQSFLALGQVQEARACFDEAIEAWKSCGASMISTLGLYKITSDLAWFDKSGGNTEKSLHSVRQSLEVLRTRMQSLRRTRNGSRPEFLPGVSTVRWGLWSGMIIACDAQASPIILEICEAQKEYENFFCSFYDSPEMVRISHSQLMNTARLLQGKGYHPEANSLAEYAKQLLMQCSG